MWRIAFCLCLAFSLLVMPSTWGQEQRPDSKPESAPADQPATKNSQSAEKKAEDKPDPSAKKAPEKPAKKVEKPQAPDRSKQAVTDIAQADADFWVQGEFIGDCQSRPFLSEPIGLQVVALGDGAFDAVIYRGGLPGAGWNRRAKDKLSGSRRDSQVILDNERWTASITGPQAELRSKDGHWHAVLRKIHRISPTLGAYPAPGATVLFDGRGANQFDQSQITPEGLLAVGALTKQAVRDFHMHLEFQLPYMPHARGQGRGNSGVYIQQRYEVQILDSFGLDGVENECGAMYRQKRPDINMCLPPLSWQTYDIYFTAARWSPDGRKLSNARITVLHNGEPVHADYSLTAKTGGGKQEGPEAFPILLQNHGNPVVFRNIWLVDRSSTSLAVGEICDPWATRYAPFPIRRAWRSGW